MAKTWLNRVRKAIKIGYFNEEDSKLSQDWNTCRIGENAKRSKVDFYDILGEKNQDGVLYRKLVNKAQRLGMEFMKAVQEGHRCEDVNDSDLHGDN